MVNVVRVNAVMGSIPNTVCACRLVVGAAAAVVATVVAALAMPMAVVSRRRAPAEWMVQQQFKTQQAK